MRLSQEMLRHSGPCTSKGGHTALCLSAHSPPPKSAFFMVASLLTGALLSSVCVCVSLSLCFYVCSEGAIQSGRASW